MASSLTAEEKVFQAQSEQPIRKGFLDQASYRKSGGYSLMPFRQASILGRPGDILLTSPVGEYVVLPKADFDRLVEGRLDRSSALYRILQSRQFVSDVGRKPFLQGQLAQQATRKLFATSDLALHIFVLTRRCDHHCHYCQISPQLAAATGFDMTPEIADAALDRVFESQSDTLTIEFQGGEASLRFDLVKYIVEQAQRRSRHPNQALRFVLATTLHLLDDEMLGFCRDHDVWLSTSLDGPQHVHDSARINDTRDSFKRTVTGIARARQICGYDRVSALATVTRYGLPFAREIIDTYVELGFHSISLRPLSPFGFAVASQRKVGYPMSDYLRFYREALDYLIELNLKSVVIEETYASLLLTRVLTPFPTAYVDLQSPAAAGSNVLVYNHDGGVYVSDEARMLAAMGDDRFRMGSVHQSLAELQESPAMNVVRSGGIAEELPTCSDCAFVPYCGADPVFHVATQGNPVGDKSTSDFCHRHMGLFQILFEKLAARDPDTMRVFLAWIRRLPASQLNHAGYMV